MKTGFFDKHGTEIQSGDYVCLGHTMTTDDSISFLPNGWYFDAEDVYEVYYDQRVSNWSLKLGVEPDSDDDREYISHAVSIMHQGASEIVGLA